MGHVFRGAELGDEGRAIAKMTEKIINSLSRRQLIVAVGILGVAVYGLVRVANFWWMARNTSAANACPGNLMLINAAKQARVLEKGQTTEGDLTWQDITPYLPERFTKQMPPKCYSGGTYIIGKIGELPRCSTGGKRHSISWMTNNAE